MASHLDWRFEPLPALSAKSNLAAKASRVSNCIRISNCWISGSRNTRIYHDIIYWYSFSWESLTFTLDHIWYISGNGLLFQFAQYPKYVYSDSILESFRLFLPFWKQPRLYASLPDIAPRSAVLLDRSGWSQLRSWPRHAAEGGDSAAEFLTVVANDWLSVAWGCSDF